MTRPAAAIGDQQGRGVMACYKMRPQAHQQQVRPFQRLLPERTGSRCPDKLGGVVDENVEPPVLVGDLCKRRSDSSVIGVIHRDSDSASAGFCHGGCGFRNVRFIIGWRKVLLRSAKEGDPPL
jgi:hypothetical protein